MVTALTAGADDYLMLPARPAELVARLEAHVRKANAYRRALSDLAEYFVSRKV